MKIVAYLLFISLVVSMACKTENSRDETESAMKEPVTTSRIYMKVGAKTFRATLADTPAAKAFVAQLPLTLTMNELNNNEKFAQLPQSVPTNASVPAGIQTGDLMMYGSSTLVLFYKSFTTTYSYTRIGKIEEVKGLIEALGTENVLVRFEIESNN